MDDGLQNPHLAPDLAHRGGRWRLRLRQSAPIAGGTIARGGRGRSGTCIGGGPNRAGRDRRRSPDSRSSAAPGGRAAGRAPARRELAGLPRLRLSPASADPPSSSPPWRQRAPRSSATSNFADHHPYTAREVAGPLSDRSESLKASLVTTTKDWVRLPPELPGSHVSRPTDRIGVAQCRCHRAFARPSSHAMTVKSAIANLQLSKLLLTCGIESGGRTSIKVDPRLREQT